MNQTKTVLVVLPLSAAHQAQLEACAPGAEFIYDSRREPQLEHVRRAQIILGNIAKPLLAEARNLEWLQLESSGTNHYTDAGILPPGVQLTNATGAFGLGMAEYMLGMVLSLQKKLPLFRDQQKQHMWRREGDFLAIHGSTTLVVGLGDIGSEFAQRMHALGSRVLAIRRTEREKPFYVDEQYNLDALDALLPQADTVALCLPSTPQTDRLLNRQRLALLKRTAILVNVGRGAAIDTEALTEALETGQLYGAALDVTDPEPLPAEHRLWGLENVIITPHISGELNIPETWQRLMDIFCHNLSAYLTGRPLINEVDFATTYRKADSGF